MRVIAVIVQQVVPRLVIQRCYVCQRRRPELRMRREKPCDLGRVEITDHALAAPPAVTVTIFRNDVPPQTHLPDQRRPYLVEQVFASSHLRCFPDVSRVLVRITIEASGWRRIVGVDLATGKLNSSAIEQLVEKRTIVGDAEVVSDTRDPRRHTEIVLREIDDLVRLRIVKALGVEQRAPRLLFLRRQALPKWIGLQVAAKVSQRQRSVELRERFASGARLNQSDLTNPLRKVATRQLAIASRLSVSSERTHERAPRKLSGRWHTKNPIGRWIQRLDRAQVCREFFAKKRVYLIAQTRSTYRTRPHRAKERNTDDTDEY